MKILQINAVYGMGSTGRIVQDIHTALQKSGNESYVMWGISSTDSNENLIRIGTTFNHKIHALLRRIDNGQGFHSNASTKRLCKKIEQLQPDIVHLHNLHSNYINIEILLKLLAEKKIPLLITLHDCWFFTGGCTHYRTYDTCMQWKNGCNHCPMKKRSKRGQQKIRTLYQRKKSLFENLDFLFFNGVSNWTTKAGEESMLLQARASKTIYNWIDSNLYRQREDIVDLKKKYEIKENEKIILGVSQGWGARKGLDDFREIAKNFEGDAKVFLVGEAKGCTDEKNLYFLGTKNKEELIELYSIADVFVNPSRMETFGLVTIEAMACGLPVVAYNNTGSAELVSKSCGELVEDGNVTLMQSAIRKILAKDRSEYSKNCRVHVKNNFERKEQIDKYLQFYKEIINYVRETGSVSL